MPLVPTSTPCLAVDGDELRLAVRVQPRAKKPGIRGFHAGQVKIALCAAPVDGKANAALIEYLADELGCPMSAVRIIKGETNREKVVGLRGVPVDRALAWIGGFES